MTKAIKIARGTVQVPTRQHALRLRDDVLLILDLPVDFTRAEADAIGDQLLDLLPPDADGRTDDRKTIPLPEGERMTDAEYHEWLHGPAWLGEPLPAGVLDYLLRKEGDAHAPVRTGADETEPRPDCTSGAGPTQRSQPPEGECS